ncbi:helix-turn-helix domain-containing protein [Mucilaginibacter sp.]|uniref:helix-turn-helix domain-containing protein n=1 Tax=Mucilaginibacter sp. TaxID=1882438 RepID=UPI002634CB29|nr:helix-turn-helix domain-containing protein [Mucilaginibacter sp.]MDB5030594.1 transcriptional regulator, AraC family [Mucilaginibacter sp.]
MKAALNIDQNLIKEQEIKDSFSISFLKDGLPVGVTRLNYHRILLLTNGTGEVMIDNRSYPISGNEVFLLSKGQLFSLYTAKFIKGYTLSFGDSFWERTPASANNCKAVLFNNVSSHQYIPVSEKEFNNLLPLFDMMHQEYVSEEYINKPDAIAAYLKVIMIKIANLKDALREGAYDKQENQLYRKFMELVIKQFSSNRSVETYAEMLGLSARKLSDICRKCGGQGAKEIIDGQLLAEAKRFLQFTSKPVKEIAYNLNFSTPEQFSHYFKRMASVSPDSYRSIFVNIGM